MTEIKSSLNQFELFSGLSKEAIDKLAPLCHSQIYESNQIIIERDSPPDNFYLIQEGMVKIIISTAEETEDSSGNVVVNLSQGQSFGEMGLVDSGTRSATVQTTAVTRLLVINCNLFNELCEKDTHLGYQVMRNIAADLSFKLRNRNFI
jgi:CRP-like cAMP-binding protein